MTAIARGGQLVEQVASSIGRAARSSGDMSRAELDQLADVQLLAAHAADSLAAADQLLTGATRTTRLEKQGRQQVVEFPPWATSIDKFHELTVAVPAFADEHLVEFAGAEGAAKGALLLLDAAATKLEPLARAYPGAFRPATDAIADAQVAATRVRDVSNVLKRGADAKLVQRHPVVIAAGAPYQGGVQLAVNAEPRTLGSRLKSVVPDDVERFEGLPVQFGDYPVIMMPSIEDRVYQALDRIQYDTAAEQTWRASREGNDLGGLFLQSALAKLEDVLGTRPALPGS